MICQRCSKDVTGIHTCKPTGLVRDLEQRIKELEAQLAHWKANHDTQVSAARYLKERQDISPERVQCHEEFLLMKQQLEIETERYNACFAALAASQAREQVLRDGLIKVAIAWSSRYAYDRLLVNGILESTSSDDTALRQYVKKEQANILREMAIELGVCEHKCDVEVRNKAKELEEEK